MTLNIDITARHFKPSFQLIELVNEKVSKVDKFTPDITRCEVILTKDNSDEIVEIHVHVKGEGLVVTEKSKKFEKSLMPAVETLINQIKKHHDKLTGKVKTHSIDFNQLTPESTNEEQYLNN